jgi:phospho-N-acetylmuramoyl-pentapeptide-transferase
MGGFMFLVPITLLTVILTRFPVWFKLIGSSILVPLGALWAFAIIGAVDDWEGIRGSRRGLGMTARTKFILQVIAAFVLAYAMKEMLRVPHMFWPASDLPLDFGWLIFLLPW